MMTPEQLPKQFEWRPSKESEGGRFYAFKTKWAGGNWPEEHIASIWPNADSTWRVVVWRDGTFSGSFSLMGEHIPTFEEAFNYLWTLVQLGEVDFSFREEEK